MLGFEIAKAFEKGELCGWAEVRNPGIAKKQFDMLQAGGAFQKFNIVGQNATAEARKAMLYEVTRIVLGKDTDNYPQEIGDCVSFGAKNAGEYLTCTEIAGRALSVHGRDRKAFADAVKAMRIMFRPLFAPYYYGTGRVYIGGGQLGNEDGSLGSWMADAVRKYGSVFANEPGVPKYSGSVAKAWGDRNAAPDLDKWKDYGTKYLVKSTAQITSWDDLVNALANGYPCPTASNVGYNMEASSDGFHRQTTNWGHQMCFIGVDETYKNEQYAIILNNWGDVHGELRDFADSSVKLPKGVLRVRRSDAEKHIRAGETFAYSNFDGFPAQKLDKSKFLMI